MKALIAYTRWIDHISEKAGVLAAVCVLLAALISAGNAVVRYGLSISSNGWLEIQWYLFAVTVMFGASLVLKLNEHVRVDLIYGLLKGNGPVYVDLAGLLIFLLPVTGTLLYYSWPLFVKVYVTGEMSSNAGGLIRWPAMITLPVGFAMVVLQGIAEVIKRIAYLRGEYPMDTHYEKPVQ